MLVHVQLDGREPCVRTLVQWEHMVVTVQTCVNVRIVEHAAPLAVSAIVPGDGRVQCALILVHLAAMVWSALRGVTVTTELSVIMLMVSVTVFLDFKELSVRSNVPMVGMDRDVRRGVHVLEVCVIPWMVCAAVHLAGQAPDVMIEHVTDLIFTDPLVPTSVGVIQIIQNYVIPGVESVSVNLDILDLIA